MNKTYLGDGVYAEYNADYSVTLTTEDGINVTNEIVLEAEVLDNLNNYLKHMFITNQMSRKNE